MGSGPAAHSSSEQGHTTRGPSNCPYLWVGAGPRTERRSPGLERFQRSGSGSVAGRRSGLAPRMTEPWEAKKWLEAARPETMSFVRGRGATRGKAIPPERAAGVLSPWNESTASTAGRGWVAARFSWRRGRAAFERRNRSRIYLPGSGGTKQLGWVRAIPTERGRFSRGRDGADWPRA